MCQISNHHPQLIDLILGKELFEISMDFDYSQVYGIQKNCHIKMKDELAINVVRTNGADNVAQGKCGDECGISKCII